MIVLMSAFLLLSAFSCGGGNKANSTSEQDEKTVVNVPQFDADSAYLYVKNQVDFGPRVPNTKEHVACGNYLASQLETFGDTRSFNISMNFSFFMKFSSLTIHPIAPDGKKANR